MDILDILQLLGGIGLFLYGLSSMSSSLEKLTGSGLERLLEKVTTSKKKGMGKIKGWGFGAGVAAIIQSSAATTIMLVGFINAGIMKVTQAMPVVFGTNLGSTITAQILRLGDLGSDNLVVQLLKPSSFAPMLVGLGAFIIVFTKNKKLKNIAGILVGLGMLFYGMTLMEEVFEPLKESAKFQEFFTSFENPFIGILTGVVITVILQSSNASVGILQALSATGTISYGVAIPIIIGQNVGKCSTTIIGGIGGNKNSKRLVVGYVFFNLFGAVLFSTVIYLLHYTIGLAFMNTAVTRSSIATVHLLFNLVTSLILLPFSEKVSKLTEKIIGKSEVKAGDEELAKLDDMLLNTPTIALDQCFSLIKRMGEAIRQNYKMATDMIYQYSEDILPQMEENESFIDKCETYLSSYIVRIDRKRLTADDKMMVNEILNSIGDFERMGDYCMSIAYVAQAKNEQEIHFSPTGHKEIETIISAVEYTIDTLVEAFSNDDLSLAIKVEPMSEVIDELKEIIKSHHVERLQEGVCSIEGGVSLIDLVNSFERITSHAANVSLHVIKKLRKDYDFDEMHGHANDMHAEEYKALYQYFENQYIGPIKEHVIIREETEDKKAAEGGKRDSSDKTGKSGKSGSGKPGGIHKENNSDKSPSKKGAKSEKTDKAAKADKTDKNAKSEKTDKTVKNDKNVKAVKNDKTSKTDKNIKGDKTDKKKKKTNK